MTDLFLQRLDEKKFRVVRSFDYHLILSIELEGVAAGVPSYWRQMDPEFSLVEVGVDEEEGFLVSVTVPLYNGLLYPCASDLVEASDEGLPVFHLEAFAEGKGKGVNENLFDVPGRCKFELGAGLVRLALFDEEVTRATRVGEGLLAEFGSSNRLVGFRLIDLNPMELTGLANAVRVPG